MEKQEKETIISKHAEIEPKYSRVEKNKGKQQANINKKEVNHLDKSEQTKNKKTKALSDDVLETNESQKLNKRNKKQVLMKLLTRN